MTWKASVTLPEDESNRYALALTETSPIQALDQLRRSTYQGVNVFAICYSVSDFREESWKEIRGRIYFPATDLHVYSQPEKETRSRASPISAELTR